MKTDNLPVKGMHCASCSTVISKTLQKMSGIKAADVNFATEKASITYDPSKVSLKEMDKAINKFGYSFDAELEEHHHNGQHETTDSTIKEIYFYLPITLLIFTLMIWDISSKIFSFIPRMMIAMELLNPLMFITAALMLFTIGRIFLKGITKFIQYGVADMDTLVGIGTLTAFVYSSALLLFPSIKDKLFLPDHTYFDATIVVIGFVKFGKYLESRSKAKTGEAIKKLIGLQAKTAVVLRNKQEIEIPIAEVKVDDLVLVKANSKIPVDGIVIDGKSSVDESMITGEPIPQDKKANDLVVGGTLNKQGTITIKANKIGSATTLAQIISLVEKAQGSKAKIQALADKIAAVFVPIVLIIAFSSLILWLTLGSFYFGSTQAISIALTTFVGVLVIACPCALGLATPTAVIAGVGKGAENGILVKDAQSLEQLHKVDTLVFDKTGTITQGTPRIDVYKSLDSQYQDQEILKLAASVEKYSQHPLAMTIVKQAKILNLETFKITNFQEMEGIGVKGTLHKDHLVIKKPTNDDLKISAIKQLHDEGKTIIIVEINQQSKGFLAVSDSLKDNAKQTIKEIHQLGLKTILLTGDNQKVAKFIGQKLGIENIKAEVMPQDKAEIVSQLQKEGQIVAMIGDGINDATALTQADVGIAMATGTDIAIESADITLLHGDLAKVLQAIKLSKLTLGTIKQNLFWAFIYNLIGIPLAAGVFYPFWGILLNPVFAGLAMALSSIFVVSNSLLLKKVKL